MAKPRSIKEVRNRTTGIVVSPWMVWEVAPGRDTIWLDCVDCDKSIVLKFRSVDAARRTSDKEAGGYFRQRGWTIVSNRCEATRCPECVKKIRAKVRRKRRRKLLNANGKALIAGMKGAV